MTPTYASALFINRLELFVHLGWPDSERLNKQMILVDIALHFLQPPTACESDHLNDTFCYATLITQLQTTLSEKTFHLIEHLTHEIYLLIKAACPLPCKIQVNVTKHPSILGLAGGVCFQYGDVP